MREPGFDEFIHVPARLSILVLLAPSEWVEFRVIRDGVGTTDSALSKQISALENAGYVHVSKDRGPGRRSTQVRLTQRGRGAFAAHAAALERIVASAHQKPAGQQE